MPVKVPLWVLAQSFTPYGSKMDPRPRTIRKNVKQCPKCGIWLWELKDEYFHKNKDYCKDCVEIARKEDPHTYSSYTPGYWDRDDWRRDTTEFEHFPIVAATRAVREFKDVSDGNLMEWEYKYWIGSSILRNCKAVCRACGDVVFGDKGVRFMHKHEKKGEWKNDETCMKVLDLCHKKLVNMKFCVGCGKYTIMAKYGVPICSGVCLEKWKFGMNVVFESLAKELVNHLPEVKDGGLKILDATSSPITIVTSESEAE